MLRPMLWGHLKGRPYNRTPLFSVPKRTEIIVEDDSICHWLYPQMWSKNQSSNFKSSSINGPTPYIETDQPRPLGRDTFCSPVTLSWSWPPKPNGPLALLYTARMALVRSHLHFDVKQARLGPSAHILGDRTTPERVVTYSPPLPAHPRVSMGPTLSVDSKPLSVVRTPYEYTAILQSI
jgi:hypothetical protein